MSPSRVATSRSWGGPFVLGLFVFLLGVLCLIAAGFTALASVLLFGGLLVVAGVVEIIHAFRRRGTGQFLLYLLGGVLSLVVGALFLFRPLEGIAALALLLAAYFFATGIFRAVTSVVDRYEGWGFDLFGGLVSVLLGVILMWQWPAASLLLVGVLVAVQLMVNGAALMAGSLALRQGLRRRIA